MALLTLKDIGKIYVSDSNVAVGIRGVNLSFDRGEFVAVTGKSGSGKSTLLNVISGMDSYEEGELFIEGLATSHYLQPEWEAYREKYISFIFQDYNIIESFTVLQNVELALMHIEDRRERRRRALALIDRVGLTSHIKHKGSRLSGGQKQRTVIARALAKDSPIILADEPTGNLDSATSAEIIALLREVSADKLLIVVTHDFEEVAGAATRHIRIFDGAVESDHTLTPAAPLSPAAEQHEKPARAGKKNIRNGITLGRSIFTAKPRLSLFLCLLMLVGTLGIFLLTAFCGEAMDIFDPNYMFNHIDGRVVLAHRDGTPLSEEELGELMAAHGAVSKLHYDILLDQGRYYSSSFMIDGAADDYRLSYDLTYGRHYGDDIIGRYPTAINEVFLYMPISAKPYFGETALMQERIMVERTEFVITGVAYYYNNNLRAECCMTEEGYRVATALNYLADNPRMQLSIISGDENQAYNNWSFGDFAVDFALTGNAARIEDSNAVNHRNDLLKSGTPFEVAMNFTAEYYQHTGFDMGRAYVFERPFTADELTFGTGITTGIGGNMGYAPYFPSVYFSPDILVEMAEEVLAKSYRQASLFFENDKAAEKAAAAIGGECYLAVPSFTEYTLDGLDAILNMLLCLIMALVFLFGILFLAFFINLCTGRSLAAFSGDMSIMRSMGIPVRVIRIGMYVRMLLSLIPAYILVALTAVFLFTSPKFNAIFTYLYPWQYALIAIGMLLLTLRVTHKQIKRLFRESVKKSLKGGEVA